jgi:pimeloyl-ACP methyl ester carboxylesterase
MLVVGSTRVAAVTTEFTVNSGGAILSGEEAGDGPAVVLLHGLTATRRYVVMGSHALERDGHRVVMYDARGHGRSSAAPSRDAYAYSDLADDLLAVLDDRGIDRAVRAGASMGAHTLLRVALLAPERVCGLVVITPAYSGPDALGPERLERWDALAAGLRRGGVEGFVEAYGEPRVGSERLARTVLTVIRQRLSQHEDPGALADVLQAVPRSMPFGEVAELAAIRVPVAVVASNDDADPEHPVAVGESYAATIPGARLITDPPGSSPVAWQGSQLSKIIAAVADQAS